MNAYRPGKFFKDAAARDAFLSRFGGQYDERRVPITNLGIYQAEQSAIAYLELHGAPPDVIVSSDADRAVMTAAKQIQHFKQPIAFRVDPRLIERSFGHLERLTEAEIAEQFPTLDEDTKRQGGFLFRPPGGESLADLAEGRVAKALSAIMAEANSQEGPKRVLVDVHLAVGRVLRWLLQKMPSEALYRDTEMKFGNGELFSFELVDDTWIPIA
jgi:broad specificity phosphatase PhoE